VGSVCGSQQIASNFRKLLKPKNRLIMHILITGGTGLIGRRLCEALTTRGDRVTVLSRRPDAVPRLCGVGVNAMKSLDYWTPEQSFDAVINLAGEPIVDARWTDRRKKILCDSRILLTEQLVEKICQANRPPQVLLSGSAIGYYGIDEHQTFNEENNAGEDFSAALCHAWEKAAHTVRATGVRCVVLRTGLVLDNRGGILKKMLLPFQCGLGSRLGAGQQWMSWIHCEDYLNAVLTLLDDTSATGPYNLTAPNPVTNADFTRSLGRAVHRPAFFVAPAWLLQLAMGERSDLLLGGQRVMPERLLANAFDFRFPHLDGALDELVRS
jgi:uncharacterized protein (TIGR01777 family)